MSCWIEQLIQWVVGSQTLVHLLYMNVTQGVCSLMDWNWEVLDCWVGVRMPLYYLIILGYQGCISVWSSAELWPFTLVPMMYQCLLLSWVMIIYSERNKLLQCLTIIGVLFAGFTSKNFLFAYNVDIFIPTVNFVIKVMDHYFNNVMLSNTN